MSERSVVGVDLGGTNVRAAVYGANGKAIGKSFSRPSHAQEGTERVVEAICDAVIAAIESSGTKPVAIGMAVPGHIDAPAGLVHWSPNFGEFRNGVFHSWKRVPLSSMIEKNLGIPAHMGNDANLAALGEYRFGVGKDEARCLVLFTVGTGIGGGVVLGPQAVQGQASGPLLLVGGNGGGGELGHMIIHADGLDCTAGSYGAIEGHCQRDAIVKRALHRLARGRKSAIRDLVKGDLDKVTPSVISEAADAGDALAIQVWQEVGTFLGYGVANAINVFAPDVVAIGGQIAKAGKWLLDPVRETARDAAIPSLFADARIVGAKRVADGGILGGVALALMNS